MEIVFSHGSVKLNEEQTKVVTADPFEHQRILASAGSGKTTTITARIAFLMERYEVPANQILLATFSRNAAREMTERIHHLCGPKKLWAGTFHALAKQILTEYDFSAIQSMFFIDELPVRWTQWMRTEKGRKWVGGLRYVIVDEFQDINAIQWRLLETMRHPGVRFIIVGDDAQNIYTWRGSSARYLLDYQLYNKSVKDYQLRMNYRSTEAIVAVANRVMRLIPTLPWKQTMVSAVLGGTKPDVLFFWRMRDESLWICRTIQEIWRKEPKATIAVLSRNNMDLYRFEEILLQEALPCRFLTHETVDPVHTAPKRNTVDLATFHGSKGLEWDYTFCICLTDERLPGRKGKEDIIGERRLFYVGITRAKKHLILTYHGNERLLSRFVREIGYLFLTFHGLAKYALSDVELGHQQPSLRTLMDSLDGDDWQEIRNQNLLPFGNLLEKTPWRESAFLPFEESWKPPTWCDTASFQSFLQLFVKRCIWTHFGAHTEYHDPFLERMIFRIRIFAEDASFWYAWEEELTQMVKEFFSDSKKMPPAGYADIANFVEQHRIPWGQAECITATSILAKIRGQLRPLRFDAYRLEEFTICPTRVVVPTEYRASVLRSWRQCVNPSVAWKDLLGDLWNLSALSLVSEGRNAALFKVRSVDEFLPSLVPYLERVERVVKLWLAQKQEWLLNPECCLEEISPIHGEAIVENSLVMMSGEQKPDLAFWTEAYLKAYGFFATGTECHAIQVLNPYRGMVWTVEPIPLEACKTLYETLLSIWTTKQ